MSKDLTLWFQYHIGDMAHRLQYCSPLAEGIVHRLFRAYYRREHDIKNQDEVLAHLARVDIDVFQQIKSELSTVIDFSTPVLQIQFLDRALEKALDISKKRSGAARGRWSKKDDEGEKNAK